MAAGTQGIRRSALCAGRRFLQRRSRRGATDGAAAAAGIDPARAVAVPRREGPALNPGRHRQPCRWCRPRSAGRSLCRSSLAGGDAAIITFSRGEAEIREALAGIPCRPRLILSSCDETLYTHQLSCSMSHPCAGSKSVRCCWSPVRTYVEMRWRGSATPEQELKQHACRHEAPSFSISMTRTASEHRTCSSAAAQPTASQILTHSQRYYLRIGSFTGRERRQRGGRQRQQQRRRGQRRGRRPAAAGRPDEPRQPRRL